MVVAIGGTGSEGERGEDGKDLDMHSHGSYQTGGRRSFPRTAAARTAAAAIAWVLGICTALTCAGPASATTFSHNGQLTPAATALLNQLRDAADRGLDPADYDWASLNREASALGANTTGVAKASASTDDTARARFDEDLTRAGQRFLSDLHFGRIDPASVGHHLTVARVDLDLAAALDRVVGAIDIPAAIDALEPNFRHYALLKRQLKRYRELAATPGLTTLPPLEAKSLKSKSLKSGDAYDGAPQLTRLLTALGDLAPAAPDPAATPPPVGAIAAAAPRTLSPALSAALAHFQRRHGEKPDGVLGAATWAELTRPLDTRVRQIELTLERWRWLPAELVSAPIIVNIPQFRLFAFESTQDSEAKIRQMDVIVGKAFEGKETPVFAADMTYLIFRPYWDVPYSIAQKEIVPAARRDLGYLEKHQMEMVRGGGDSAPALASTRENVELLAKGTLRVRQRPGPDNSLGLVKFMLPNPYNVYLHSTPAQSLFGQSRRDFSHGCVRVSDPKGLAAYVLRDSPEWTSARIEEAMNGTTPLTVKLKQPIRVFIVYGTALATENGEVSFFDDIYGQDARLEAALAARHAHGG